MKFAPYTSGRLKQLKVGITSHSEDKTPFEVVGNVSVGGSITVNKSITVNNISITSTTSVSEFSNLNISGVSTFNGNSFFDSNVAIGTDNVNAPVEASNTSILAVGILTANRIYSTVFGEFTGGSVVAGEIVGTGLSISGISTFTGIIDANGGVDISGGSGLNVTGHTELDNVNVSGIASASAFANFGYLQAPFGSTVNFTVTVAGKDATHRYNGQGSGNAYLINGVQSPVLTLTPGRTYRFTNNNTGSHPLKFYLEANRTTLYTTGVNFQNTYTEITISDTTPNVLHYQCTNHALMGNAIITNSNVVDTPYDATFRGNIVGDNATNISGINSVTATSFFGDGSNLTGIAATDNVRTDSLVVSGVSTFNDNVNLPDNKKIQLGDNGDLQLYHNGTSSYIDNNTGAFYIRNNVDDDDGGNIIIEAKSGKASAVFQDDEGVRLYYNDAEKIATTGYGVTVNGTTQTQQLNVTGVSTFGGNAIFNGTVNTVHNLLQVDGNTTLGVGASDNIDPRGSFVRDLIPSAQATQNLGSSTRRWKTLHVKNIEQSGGISTFANDINANGNIIGDNATNISGINSVTASTFHGSGAGLTDIDIPGISTSGTSNFNNLEAQQLNITGVSTFAGNIVGDNATNISGINSVTATSFFGNGAGLTNIDIPGISTSGTSNFNNLHVAGVSTFVGLVTVTNGDVHIAQRLFVGGLEVEGGGEGTFTGVSTFTNQTDNVLGNSNTGAVQINGGVGIDKNLTVGAGLSVVNGLEVGGISTLNTLNVTGVSTFSSTVNIDDGVSIHFGGGKGKIKTTGSEFYIQSTAGNDILLESNQSGGTAGDIVLKSDGTTIVQVPGDKSGVIVTGILTATDFSGNISGVGATFTNITGTLQTAAQPNITSLGTLTSLNVSGDVSIGGTLTYEDVTNVDSIGLITARTGIKVLSGGINAVGVVTATSFSGDLTGTATTATNINVTANNSTNEVVYPIFVDGATGSQGAETDTNLYYNPSSNELHVGAINVNTLTASLNILANGNIVGDNATNISGINSVTATSFFGSGANLTNLPGIGTDGSINTTGIITAASFSGDGQDLEKVSIGSTDGNFIGKGFLQARKTTNAGGDRGNGNIILGRFAGCCHDGGSFNVYLGEAAGRKSTGQNTDRNVFIGCQAGCGHTTGYSNVFLGSEAGKGDCGSSGSMNVFAGLKAGIRNTGCYNIAFGKHSYGRETGTKNIAIGFHAAVDVGAGGTSNVFIGEYAGNNAQFSGPPFRGGQYNVYLGSAAGYNNPGDHNIGIGENSLFGVGSQTGCRNIGLGDRSGSGIEGGSDNIMLGSCSGRKITTGGCNILLGYNSGCNATATLRNVYVGTHAGKNVCGGAYDVALGSENLCDSKWACNNIAIGKNIFKKANCQGPSADALFNIGIGEAVGTGLTTGGYNLMLGYQGGYCLTCGSDNIVFGRRAGRRASESTNNIFIGCYAGRSTVSAGCAGQANIAIGNLAGSQVSSTSDRNIFIGNSAGAQATGGCFNIALGADAATYLTGDRNIFIGQYSGFTQNVSGDKNVVIGDAVCLLSATGSTQLVIGAGATHWIDGDSSFNVTLAGIATVTKSTGVVEATKFCGDGSCLSGVGFSPDAQENLVAGTGAGAAKDADTCFNIMLGCNAGNALNQGDKNILLGCNSGKCLTSGGCNIFLGRDAGCRVTDKSQSVFIGDQAGRYSTGGNAGNILIGQEAGRSKDGCANTGELNIAIGSGVMQCMNTASGNTVIGWGAGKTIDTGSYNTTFGRCAGRCISSGGRNIAIGCAALGGATVTGNCNVVLGHKAALDMTSGYMNIIIGDEAGENMTAANNNIALGFQAGENLDGATVSSNILLGYRAGQGIAGGTSVSNNIFLGRYTGRNVTNDASNNVSIGRQSAKCITSACSNTFIGNYAGCRVTTGCNLYIGHKSGNGGGSNITGTHNIAIGYEANVPDITGNTQFVIGCCTCNWIVGNSNFNVGIGTTNPDLAVGVGNTAKLAVGIVSAYQFYGDASQMTGAGFTQDAQGNLVAGTNAGANKDADTCFNVLIGCNAGEALNGGDHTIFIGQNAGRCLQSNGTYNIGLGKDALCSQTTGHNNIAIGFIAGRSLINGCCNLFFGAYSGFQGVCGNNNTAFGVSSLKRVGCCGRGDRNTGIGDQAGSSMSCGCDNTFLGHKAGSTTQSGSNNVLIGSCVKNPLQNDSNFLAIGVHNDRWITGNGDFNVGIGTTNPNAPVGAGNTNKLSVGILSAYQLYGDGSNLSGVGFAPDAQENLVAGTCSGCNLNSNGCFNVTLGACAGKSLTGGDNNILLGKCAGYSFTGGYNNIAIGMNAAKSAGSGAYYNIAIGIGALEGGSSNLDNIVIGRNAGPGPLAGSDNYQNFIAGHYAGFCYANARCNIVIGLEANYETTSAENTIAIGRRAAKCQTTGNYNIAFGNEALRGSSTKTNNTGGNNIAIGKKAGTLATSGGNNILLGQCTGYNVSSGSQNIIIGLKAGCAVTTGADNIAIGRCAMLGVNGGNVTGTENVVIGTKAGFCLSTGNYNTFVGSYAGNANSTGSQNTYIGYFVAAGVTTPAGARYNVAVGNAAAYCMTSGRCNVFLGSYAGCEMETGCFNVAIGHNVNVPVDQGSCQLAIGRVSCAGTGGEAANYWIVGNCDFNVGIGTTNPNAAVGVGNTNKLSVGILSAYQLYGDGSNLSGVGFSQDSNCNLIAGFSAGTCANATPSTFNIIIGCGAGCFNGNGEHNVVMGTHAGLCAVGARRNVLIGMCAGSGVNNGKCNVYLGNYAGAKQYCSDNIAIGCKALCGSTTASNNTGTNNIALGLGAGTAMTSGSCNILIGKNSGSALTTQSDNVYMGRSTGLCQTSGNDNVFLGRGAGQCVTDASRNVFIGKNAGRADDNGFSKIMNVFIGNYSGECTTNASGNVFLGACSGKNTTCGLCNTFVGMMAGATNTLGDYNVAIGYNVCLPTTTGNKQLAIGCCSCNWIVGNSDFNVGIGTTNPKTDFQVGTHYGVVGGGGTFTAAAGVAHTINEYTIASTDFKTAEYTIFANTGSKIQSQKLLVMQDGTTAYSQEYAVMSSDTLLVSADATLAGGVVKIEITPETGVSGLTTFRFTRHTML